MTTLAEFKEIAANIESEINMGREPFAKIASKGMICYEAFPALIAVAEGMEKALDSGQVLAADVHNRFIGQGIDPDACHWFVDCREDIKQALAAYEAWKGKIEGEG